MITFKDFLIEARSAPLYHKTGLGAFYHILKDRAIAPKTTHMGHSKPGVSLTRSIKTAMNWRNYEPGIIIEIDQQKLIHNSRVKPINIANIWNTSSRKLSYMHAKYEELFEEFVEGPVDAKFFTRFIVPSQVMKVSWEFETQRDYLMRIINLPRKIEVFCWDTKKTIDIGKLELEY